MEGIAVDLKELNAKHKDYTSNVKTWEYLQASYAGGEEYRKAALLYKYVFEETDDEKFKQRLDQTPLDNKCESTIHTYSSFIWKQAPQRDLGRLEKNLEALQMLEDADMDETPLNEFMREVQIAAGIYGHCWIVMDKSSEKVGNLRQARSMGIRPYLSLYIPVDVWDWRFERNAAGRFELTYIKYVEEETDAEGQTFQIFRIWNMDSFEVYRVQAGKGDDAIELIDSGSNELGMVPAVCHVNKKSRGRGIGISDIKDVAKMQQGIYNDLSELAQTIRNTNHSTLVKNEKDSAVGGAGGVIVMDDDTEAAKKPYLLQPQLFQMEGLLKAIEKKENMINTMTHLLPVRQVRTQPASGVAIQTEFQLLNSLLAEKAASLQMTEYRLVRIFCAWIGKDANRMGVVISYPTKFELRDRESDLRVIEQAKKLRVKSSTYYQELDKMVANITLEDDTNIESIHKEIESTEYEVMEEGDGSGAGGEGE